MPGPRNILGPVVKQLREQSGLTQAELCTKLNLLGWDVSRDTLAKLESQVRWLADFEAVKLAAALAVDIAELYRRAAQRHSKRPPSYPSPPLKRQT